MNDFEKRYNNLVKEHIDTIERNENKTKEIERLNNIINEFDKFLFGELQIYGGGGIAQEYYDKLQELKGSDKE